MRQFVLCAAVFAAASGLGLGALADPAQAPAGPRTTASRAAPASERASRRLLPPESGYLLGHIARMRAQTWRWQALMGRARTPSSDSARRSRDSAYRRWVLSLWRRRASVARRQASNPPNERRWQCIHRYEGAWNDPSAPYYGGLQMDISFQRSYGSDLLRRKGTADNWTPLEQMWVAERAYRSGRGFTPWPNTARACGLL